METPRILFIARAFPPIIGGMEKQNFEVCKSLGKRATVIPLVNTRGKSFLPIFLLRCFWKVFRLKNDYDVILLGDAVLAIVAYTVKCFSKVPIYCIAHGLDLTYSGAVYRLFWRNFFFHFIDGFIAVSHETINQAHAQGLDKSRFRFIPNGVDTTNLPRVVVREELIRVLGYRPPGPVLLTLGRLVKRKGVVWFIRNVMPYLSSEVTYIIAGRGRESAEIQKSIRDTGLEQRVKFLGSVSSETKEILLSASDLFVQPNIPVADDMEGFGLVVLEAALAGTMVIASRLEGLKDAIVEGKNGMMVEPMEAEEYRQVICELLSEPERLARMGEQAHDYVVSECSWDSVVERYLDFIKEFKIQSA